MFDLAQGGGALLDLGIYPLSCASSCSGTRNGSPPMRRSEATGVDEQVVAVLGYPDGAAGRGQGSRSGSPMACTGRIAGTEGSIDIPAFMHCPDHLIVNVQGNTQRIEAAWPGDGLQFQVIDMQRRIEAGQTESPLMPLGDSLALVRMMDAIRRQIGLVYPDE